jgi:hypothetical protein
LIVYQVASVRLRMQRLQVCDFGQIVDHLKDELIPGRLTLFKRSSSFPSRRW